ncbi:unnamed protein product [Adineta ricciae]|uniref:Uncharacterized protein n=1 Tax=Adineta ricciae TaxID=249248 RepID=A0A813YXF3_ADIRI|nr:unnamed protein product [Adineta ricciae]
MSHNVELSNFQIDVLEEIGYVVASANVYFIEFLKIIHVDLVYSNVRNSSTYKSSTPSVDQLFIWSINSKKIPTSKI